MTELKTGLPVDHLTEKEIEEFTNQLISMQTN